MMGLKPSFEHEASSTMPVYVNPDQMFDTSNIRFRHQKLHTSAQPAHFVLTTSDYQAHGAESNSSLTSRYKHNTTQIIFLIFTTCVYFLQAVSAYMPENTPTFSQFWFRMKSVPAPRAHTSDLRPSLKFEHFLVCSAEACQTVWVAYILSFIFKRTAVGYLYRHPNVFNTSFCFLLISAPSLRVFGQTWSPPEIPCACLFLSYILLVIACRLVAVKVLRYEDKYKSTELAIMRYFLLNSLFLYTTSIGYLTICASMECIASHVDADPALLTTLGLSIGLLCLVIYVLLDQWAYKEEFRSIWTPYLFLTMIFLCPPLRQLLPTETYSYTNRLNYSLLWLLFSVVTSVLLIRMSRPLFARFRALRAGATPMGGPVKAAEHFSSSASKQNSSLQL